MDLSVRQESPETGRSYSLSMFSQPEMIQRFSQQSQLFSPPGHSAFHSPSQTFSAFNLVNLQAHHQRALQSLVETQTPINEVEAAESNKRKSSTKNTESSKKSREKSSHQSKTKPPAAEDSSGGGPYKKMNKFELLKIPARPRISCPVCSDTAVPHFHYGGMCCYSCKAFFRRVVNTYKVTAKLFHES